MNKSRIANIFWGLALIAAGCLALAQSLGVIEDLAPTVWIVAFAGISLISFVTYFVSGVRNWGWLFPACIFAGLALTLYMATNGVDSAAVGSPLFVAIAVPFVVVYAQERGRNWWALIPTGVMAFLTFATLVVDSTRGELVGAGLFFILAAVFGLVWLSKRYLWAALVAYIMFVMGFMPLLAMGSRPELAGIIMLFGIGLPFLGVYLTAPEQRWWAVIPAGMLVTTGLLTAIILLPGLPGPDYDNRFANFFVLAGYSVTFAVVWLRHQRDWAKWVTLLGAAMAVMALIFHNYGMITGPVALIAVGVYLLTRTRRPRDV